MKPFMLAVLCAVLMSLYVGAATSHATATFKESSDSDSNGYNNADAEMMYQEVKDHYANQEARHSCKCSCMKVLFAYYGLSCANGDIREAVKVRSTNWVAKLCNGKSVCKGTVHTRILTDPYGGCRKDFFAVAQCENGRIITDLVRSEAQNRQFSLACN